MFTSNREQKFADIDMSKYKLVNKAHQIYFETEAAELAYSSLLGNRCKVCKRDFQSWRELDAHLRKRHELFVCELCVDNLKVFSHERKYYSRRDLARHRKAGDIDDTSHRGHPLCHFCDQRYVDDEDLHRHLRRDHFFCHFCDPLGLSQYYDTYDHLRIHLRKEHYLCEEGPCREERFTTAFSNDIDLQAHRAQVHCVTKTDAKQARILSLDFSLTPRGGGQVGPQFSASVHHQPFRNLPGQRKTKAPQLDNQVNDDSEPLIADNTPQEVPGLDAFPSLGGAAAAAPLPGKSYAAVNKPRPEDFPSLGPASNPGDSGSSALASSSRGAAGGKQKTLSYASNALKFKDSTQKPVPMKSKGSISSSSKSSTSSKSNGIGNFSSRAGGGPLTSSHEEDFPSLPVFMPPSHVPSIQKKELKQYGTLSSIASAVASANAARTQPSSKLGTVASLPLASSSSSTLASQQQSSRSKPASYYSSSNNEEFPSLPIPKEKKRKKNAAPSVAASASKNSTSSSSSSATTTSSNANSSKKEKLTLASLAANNVTIPGKTSVSKSKVKPSDSPSPDPSIISTTDETKPLLSGNEFPGLGNLAKALSRGGPSPGLSSSVAPSNKHGQPSKPPPPGFDSTSSKQHQNGNSGSSSSNGNKQPPPGFERQSSTSGKKPPPPPGFSLKNAPARTSTADLGPDTDHCYF